MTEKILYQRYIKPLFQTRGYFIQRFEQENIPDIFLAEDGYSCWVELTIAQ